MFIKKYKVKSSTTIKGSERKKLRNMIETNYPSLTPEDLDALVSSKNELVQSKVLLHNGSIVMLYYSDKTPIFFICDNNIFPTVYILWKFQNLVPSVPTTPNVLDKLQNGADLMAPGIIMDDSSGFKNLKEGDVCGIIVEGNQAVVAVGITLMSGKEMIAEDRKGKAVHVMHCYKDNLWASGDQSILPVVNDIISEKCEELSLDNQDEVNKNVEDDGTIDNVVSDIVAEEHGNCDESEKANGEMQQNVKEYTMDDILMQCFMLILKAEGKKLPLPILTSTFYSAHVLGCCPTGFSLDIKKTSFKKLSVFLKSEFVKQFIEVKELTKGVESIIGINVEHEAILSFVPDVLFRQRLKQQKAENIVEAPQVQDNYKFPDVCEVFVVSGQVKQIFESLNHKKGEPLMPNTIRQILREYVKVNSLQDDTNPRIVVLDPILSNCLLRKNDPRTRMTWEELFEITTRLMSPAFFITFDGEEAKLKKGHVDPINISLATRTGNKKVTLINNLENFGIRPEKLANHVQTAVAASTSVTQAPNGKGTQVLIQGNQLKYLQTLFFDIYKVPKKYVQGLDNIPSKKKK